jgi:hypothetical protein
MSNMGDKHSSIKSVDSTNIQNYLQNLKVNTQISDNFFNSNSSKYLVNHLEQLGQIDI